MKHLLFIFGVILTVGIAEAKFLDSPTLYTDECYESVIKLDDEVLAQVVVYDVYGEAITSFNTLESTVIEKSLTNDGLTIHQKEHNWYYTLDYFSCDYSGYSSLRQTNKLFKPDIKYPLKILIK